MAKKLNLSVCCGDYEIVKPLSDGLVEADGLDLTFLTRPEARERHWRMARNMEYDVCEFNVGQYFIARELGYPLTAIPIFLHRRFRHGFLFVNASSGINEPKDLIGKRIGGTNFTPAANIWMRGILSDTYGIDFRDMTWVVDRDEDVPFTPPAGLNIEKIPAGKVLDHMLAEGELPAMMTPNFPDTFVDGDPRVVRLFKDHRQVERDYFNATGIYPIMHVMVIKEEIVREHPWVAVSLVRAFEEAKQLAYQRALNPRMLPYVWISEVLEEQRELMGPDPWAYGLGASNRNNIETVIRYCAEQGLISRQPKIEELIIDTDLQDAAGGIGRY